MVNKIVVGVLAVMVASIVLIATLPIYGSLSGTSVIVDNEGAGELRFNLADNHAEYNISVTWGDDNIIVANGTDTQAISYDNPTILYADENLAVWYDGNEAYILAPEGDGYATGTVADDLTIVKNSSGLSVTIGEGSPVSYSAPAWAYIANSAGKYGYFEDGTEIKTPTNNRLAVVGSFAGVYCYNQYNNYDLPISLELTQEGNVLSGAKWVKALQEPDTALEPFDPSDISITPLDPGVIDLDPEPDVSIMAMPTPTYTSGEWGYDLNGGHAVIVSYSGSGGEIVIPSVVDTYDVKEIGKRISGYTVFDNSALASNSTLTIPEGVERINSSAFKDCTNITGKIILPSTLTSINGSVFSGCTGITELSINDGLTSIGSYDFSGLTGIVNHPLILPSSLTYIGNQAFTGDTGFNGLVSFLESGAEISGSAFTNNTNIKQILNFGTYEFTTTSSSLNADEIKTDIPALGYISAVEFTESTQAEGAVYDLLNLVPLLSVFGLVLGAIAVFLIRRV